LEGGKKRLPTQLNNEDTHNMKTFASALIGLSLMVGTVLAQTPAPSNNSTTPSSTNKVKKHKKHAAKKSGNTATPAAK
jgi:hypothetical protein